MFILSPQSEREIKEFNIKKIHRNSSEFIAIHQISSEFIEVHRNSSEFIGINRNSPESLNRLIQKMFPTLNVFYESNKLNRMSYVNIA